MIPTTTLNIGLRPDDRVESIIREVFNPFLPNFIDITSDLNEFNNVDCLWIDMTTPIDESMLSKLPKLRYVVSPTTGLTHLGPLANSSGDIEVISLRGDSQFLKKITSTPELAWSLALTVWRQIIPASESYTDDIAIRQKFSSKQLNGLTVGLIGFGRIGRMLNKYAQAFGMKTIFFDPNLLPDDKASHDGANQLQSISEVCQECDILFLVASHDFKQSNSYPILRREHLMQLRSESIVINVSRGSLLDEDALFDFIKNHKIAGAGLDVLAREEKVLTTTSLDPLQTLQREGYNVVVTPHIGGMCWDAFDAAQRHVAQKLMAKVITRQ
jgi:D-3-phosphoglycerate dehydrogenase